MERYVEQMRKKIGASSLFVPSAMILGVHEENKVLLLHRKDTETWGLPSGAMELGETFEEAAARQLKEETGLTAHKLQFMDILSGEDYYFKYPNGDEVYNIISVFLAIDPYGSLQCNFKEAKKLSFFSQENLPPLEKRTSKVLLKVGATILE
jgi:8-oxo-dGTP pyrophosphatase MutT (NUDIX family)